MFEFIVLMFVSRVFSAIVVYINRSVLSDDDRFNIIISVAGRECF